MQHKCISSAAQILLWLKLAQKPVETNTPTLQKRSRRAVAAETTSFNQQTQPHPSQLASIPLKYASAKHSVPQQLCHRFSWPFIWACQQARDCDFPAGIRYHIIIATCYWWALLRPTPRRLISHRRKMCVCLSKYNSVCSTLPYPITLHHRELRGFAS